MDGKGDSRTCVGNTRGSRRPGSWPAVHPHARGERGLSSNATICQHRKELHTFTGENCALLGCEPWLDWGRFRVPCSGWSADPTSTRSRFPKHYRCSILSSRTLAPRPEPVPRAVVAAYPLYRQSLAGQRSRLPTAWVEFACRP